jgi:hypothetical protein
MLLCDLQMASVDSSRVAEGGGGYRLTRGNRVTKRGWSSLELAPQYLEVDAWMTI